MGATWRRWLRQRRRAPGSGCGADLRTSPRGLPASGLALLILARTWTRWPVKPRRPTYTRSGWPVATGRWRSWPQWRLRTAFLFVCVPAGMRNHFAFGPSLAHAGPHPLIPLIYQAHRVRRSVRHAAVFPAPDCPAPGRRSPSRPAGIDWRRLSPAWPGTGSQGTGAYRGVRSGVNLSRPQAQGHPLGGDAGNLIRAARWQCAGASGWEARWHDQGRVPGNRRRPSLRRAAAARRRGRGLRVLTPR